MTPFFVWDGINKQKLQCSHLVISYSKEFHAKLKLTSPIVLLLLVKQLFLGL